jgi:aryl-phospho-beta-D-glucosidase BglC (GH1 family)
MKNVLIGIAIFLAVVLLLAVGFLVWGHIYGQNYTCDAPEHIELTPNEHSTITAVGKGLYDEEGNRFDIKGVNFGNLFIAEGWMTVNSVGALMNEDGEYSKVSNDGNDIVEEYEEIYQEEMDEILSRFTDEELTALNDAYFESYCTEADFELISDLGLNTIRIPLYYRNFLSIHDRYRVSDEELCAMDFNSIELNFEKLDKFLAYAKQYDLKVIIDMHGVMGGQSGYEHCGTRDIDFWDNEEYITFMCNLWRAIAEHYIDSEYSSTILAYDLVNEPTNRNEAGTGKKQWKVMDRLYDAIREVDTDHVISIEGVWFPISLPNPDKYDWENVLYQYHCYNWPWQGTSNELYYAFIFGLASISNYDVPKLVGEFTFFDDTDAWVKYLNAYDQHGWGWTIWSYKMISVGYWDNSWGIVVQKLHLYNKEGQLQDNDPTNDNLKLDLRYASYDEIMSAWSDQTTSYGDQEGVYTFVDSIDDNGNVKYATTYRALLEYFAQEKFK